MRLSHASIQLTFFFDEPNLAKKNCSSERALNNVVRKVFQFFSFKVFTLRRFLKVQMRDMFQFRDGYMNINRFNRKKNKLTWLLASLILFCQHQSLRYRYIRSHMRYNHCCRKFLHCQNAGRRTLQWCCPVIAKTMNQQNINRIGGNRERSHFQKSR